MARKRKTAGTAQQRFAELKAEIDERLARLADLSDRDFNLQPDSVTWGHVGDLAYYNSLLKRATDAAFSEGEHAA